MIIIILGRKTFDRGGLSRLAHSADLPSCRTRREKQQEAKRGQKIAA